MKIKLIIPLTLTLQLLATSLIASSYVGFDVGRSKTTINGGVTASQRETSSVFGLKYIYGKDGSSKYQVRLSYNHYFDPIFDEHNQDLYDLGFDYIHEFDAQHDIYPYVKIGMGLGTMSIDNASRSHINALSFNAGFGVSFRLPKHFYLVTGFEYVGRSWQDIDYVTATEKSLTTYSYGLGLYVGVNYGF